MSEEATVYCIEHTDLTWKITMTTKVLYEQKTGEVQDIPSTTNQPDRESRISLHCRRRQLAYLVTPTSLHNHRTGSTAPVQLNSPLTFLPFAYPAATPTERTHSPNHGMATHSAQKNYNTLSAAANARAAMSRAPSDAEEGLEFMTGRRRRRQRNTLVVVFIT